LAYSSTKVFPGGRKIELLGMIAEEFAMDPSPNERPFSVDVHLVTPSFAAGRYSSSFTPRADGSSFPPAALMRFDFRFSERSTSRA